MTVTDEELEDFLEHFGKKGMKWGQRQRVKGGRTNEQKVKTGLKIFGGVVAVAAIAGGAVYANKFMHSNGHVAVKAISRGVQPSPNFTKLLKNPDFAGLSKTPDFAGLLKHL